VKGNFGLIMNRYGSGYSSSHGHGQLWMY
jgi:hypothetical protein